jgi:hypothetical protein
MTLLSCRRRLGRNQQDQTLYVPERTLSRTVVCTSGYLVLTGERQGAFSFIEYIGLNGVRSSNCGWAFTPQADKSN